MPTITEPLDSLRNEKDAKTLAARIREFWGRLGFQVEVRVIRTETRAGPVWALRSDMAGGLPRNFRPLDAYRPAVVGVLSADVKRPA